MLLSNTHLDGALGLPADLGLDDGLAEMDRLLGLLPSTREDQQQQLNFNFDHIPSLALADDWSWLTNDTVF